jgi:hypothetical protein
MKGKSYEVLVSYEGRFLLEAIPTKLLKQPANFETQCETRVDNGLHKQTT